MLRESSDNETMRASLIFSTIIISLQSTVAISAETFEFFNGIRQMGMGGASIAVVNDETALIANPAALGKLRDSFTTVFDPELDYGKENSNVATGNTIFSAANLQGMLDQLKLHPNKRFHLRSQLFPSYVTANFGVGVFGKYTVDGEVDGTVTPNVFHLDVVQDLAFVIGYNFRIWDGRIKFGFNAKYINRTELKDQDPQVPLDTTGLRLADFADEGGAMAADIGLIITLPWAWLPTIAGVVRDAGGTKFTFAKGILHGGAADANDPNYPTAQVPKPISQTIDAAFALFPITAGRTRMTITGEYTDVTNVNLELDSAKKIHAGFELNFSDLFFFRGGWNQRYWTAGLELAYADMQFQMASYGEEIGTVDVNREDRRYSIKFAYRY